MPKPVEMCLPDAAWPPPRQTVRRMNLRVVSLHHLPTSGENRPARGGPHMACHSHVPHLSGPTIAPKPSSSNVSSPCISVELYAIAGFCCVSDVPRPKSSQVRPQQRIGAVEDNGLVAEFGQRLYCLAAEPRETILRVAVVDDEVEAAVSTPIVTNHYCRVFELYECELLCSYRK